MSNQQQTQPGESTQKTSNTIQKLNKKLEQAETASAQAYRNYEEKVMEYRQKDANSDEITALRLLSQAKIAKAQYKIKKIELKLAKAELKLAKKAAKKNKKAKTLSKMSDAKIDKVPAAAQTPKATKASATSKETKAATKSAPKATKEPKVKVAKAPVAKVVKAPVAKVAKAPASKKSVDKKNEEIK
jgi:CRISPR/Cas system-associated endonuclease/helicase Cas3